jgi:protein TonB
MSPAALALAVGLHVLFAAALWWASPLRHLDHAETPIMISMEQEPLSIGNTETMASTPPKGETASPPPASTEAKPPEATPQPSQLAAAAPAEPTPAPPPERTPEPTPAPVPPPPAPEVAQHPPAPPPELVPEPAPIRAEATMPLPAPAETESATTAPEMPSEAETETAWQTDASSWKPQVTLEPSLAPPPRPIRPAPRPPTAPRMAQSPGQRLQDYPPQTSSLGLPSGSSMESAMADGGARNDYLSRVYRHIDPYRDYPSAARAARQHGRVVTRVTINRSGELLDIRLDHSSGWPLLDNAEMAAIRRAMPLPPVPAGMRGDPVVLVLPMNY